MAQARRPLPPEDSGPGDPLDVPTTPEPVSPEPPVTPIVPLSRGTVIKVGGREFTVDPELAAEWERDRQSIDRKFGDQGRELGELRTWRRQVEQQLKPKPDADAYDYDTQLFERPRQTLERFGQELEQRLTSRYEAADTQRRHWERFYKANDDLADEDRLVRAIAADMMTEDAWQHSQDVHAFLDEAAKRTRQELLRITRKTREADADGTRQPSGRRPVEGGGSGRRTTEAATPPVLKSISDLVEEQASKRRRTVAE
jgi:hypothetical protein